MAFAELCATSNFTFLTGGSHPQEYARRATELGLAAFAIADRNSVAGVVRAHLEAREIAREGGPASRLIPAARLRLTDGTELTALPRSRAGWARLCRVLTDGARRAKKGDCRLEAVDLDALGAGVRLLLHPPQGRVARDWRAVAHALAARLPDLHLVAAPRYDGQDRPRFDRLAAAGGGPRRSARRLGRAADAPRRPPPPRRRADLHPQGVRIDAIGRAALANAERRLRSEAEMLRLFAGHEAAVRRAGEIAGQLRLLARRAALRIPARDLGRRGPAGPPRPPDRRGPGLALPGRGARHGPRPVPSTNWR